jgi:hypothetical protein
VDLIQREGVNAFVDGVRDLEVNQFLMSGYSLLKDALNQALKSRLRKRQPNTSEAGSERTD